MLKNALLIATVLLQFFSARAQETPDEPLFDSAEFEQRGAVVVNEDTLFFLYDQINGITPRERAELVSQRLGNILRSETFSPDSFRVAWSERHYENGQLARTERWTAILTLVIDPPRTADRLRANPLGIYVNAINWSREMSQ